MRTVNLTAWDQCSAQHGFAPESVDGSLRDNRDYDSVFGGVPTVLGGDSLQTLPIVKRGYQSDIVHALLMYWPALSPDILKLETNMCVGNVKRPRFCCLAEGPRPWRALNGRRLPPHLPWH
jgi:hypothetical protein